MKNVFQEHIAQHLAEAFRAAYPGHIEAVLVALPPDVAGLEGFIYGRLEVPRDRTMGDFAFPAFSLAASLKEKPAEIARKVAAQLDPAQFSAAGPYINAVLSVSEIAAAVLPLIHGQGTAFGNQSVGEGKKIAIDYSSPNIAKPFGVGHLRSTAIGHSLYRIYEKLGYRPIGINHLGDWGTQFGKMIVAYRKWGRDDQLAKEPITYLYDLYVRFHAEEEKDPSLSEDARLWFKKLEDGDPEAVRLWTLFKEYSLTEFQRIYDILGITFDHYTGESFYNDRIEAVMDILRRAGLVTESQGAQVVELEPYGMPACLLKKADGATLYATRELAGIFYRYETFHFDRALYVVGASQQEHFKQVFKVIELLGEPYADKLVHVEFGWIKFKDQAMSTRKGNIIFLEDVIATAEEKAAKIIRDKNPGLPNLEATARMIALGAILFADLGVKKHKDVNFSWEEVLNFEGETGPYLQYTHARLSSLIRRYGRPIAEAVDFGLISSPEEKELLLHLYRFGQTVETAAERYEPNYIAEYLLELAAVFNRFYQRKDAEGKLVKIISDREDETGARMLLVAAVRSVLNEGLRLLGIPAPEEM
ncbi:MAG: arginine--tRNA ligase [candidate division Zixibacteria bacterium]|nr:arginine--tRNA ligase [candidate division Zixibacteria bacterium]